MQLSKNLVLLGVLAAATASLHAQCYEPQTGSGVGTGDDVVLGIQALGFAFPFGGQTYTHVHPSTNGFVYLSNAGTPAPGGALCCTGVAATLVAGSPMVAPYWSDLNVISGTGQVKFNALPGKAVITWENAVEYGDTNQFSVQLQLTSSGEIYFAYDGRCAIRTAGDFLVGMSEGNGATLPSASDWSAGGVTLTTTGYEIFNNTSLAFDLASKTVQFVAAAPGYVVIPQACAGSTTSYGTGCYNVSNSFYQLTVAPAASAAALANSAITLIPTGTGYLALNLGTYVPPSGAATALVLTDDSEVTTPTLPAPFSYPGGSTSSFVVCSNGFVSAATGNGVGYAPNVATMLSNPNAGWYSWHDYNPGAAGSGQVKFEQVGSITYITWDGVYNFSGTSAADAATFQFQFDASNGNVTIAHQSVSPNPHTGFQTGEPHLVGWSPAGPSNDPGSITFATGLPVQTSLTEMSPLLLSSNTPAVSSPTSGSVLTYTTSNIPEFAPAAGVYVALHILSIGQVAAPGLDLGFLGAPGCPALVASLDLTTAMVGTSSQQSVNFNLPAGIPVGTTFYSQSAALFAPNSLPNGQNAFGMTTSNGLAITVGAW